MSKYEEWHRKDFLQEATFEAIRKDKEARLKGGDLFTLDAEVDNEKLLHR